ncbi:MAG: DUF4097 family beta strand repeat protein [Chthoniobacterales bacterium]|nr:DUF4097 family beta strand repeat protein [Chthoniobacterales bacterium]
MHNRLALLLLLIAAPAFARTEQNVAEEFDAAPGGKLIVDVDFGTIDVTASGSGKVVVDAYRKIDSSEEAREKEYVADSPILVTKEGDTVTVRARSQNRERSNWNWSGNVTMDARYRVQLPKQFNVDLHTRGGSVSVTGIKGEIKSDTSGGKLKFTQLEGPIDGKTSGGSIEMSSCNGDSNINTSGGSIDVKSGRGRLDARTSGGSIAVRDYVGDTDVKTSGGRLALENVSGKITGKTSAGSIDLSLADPVTDDVNLDSSAGSIDVIVPPKAGLTVDAKTSMGKIRTEIPMLAMKSDDDRLQGTLNGGGKSLVLRASVGSITIKPNTAAMTAR